VLNAQFPVRPEQVREGPPQKGVVVEGPGLGVRGARARVRVWGTPVLTLCAPQAGSPSGPFHAADGSGLVMEVEQDAKVGFSMTKALKQTVDVVAGAVAGGGFRKKKKIAANEEAKSCLERTDGLALENKVRAVQGARRPSADSSTASRAGLACPPLAVNSVARRRRRKNSRQWPPKPWRRSLPRSPRKSVRCRPWWRTRAPPSVAKGSPAVFGPGAPLAIDESLVRSTEVGQSGCGQYAGAHQTDWAECRPCATFITATA
jgi:hypothetical protein